MQKPFESGFMHFTAIILVQVSNILEFNLTGTDQFWDYTKGWLHTTSIEISPRSYCFWYCRPYKTFHDSKENFIAWNKMSADLPVKSSAKKRIHMMHVKTSSQIRPPDSKHLSFTYSMLYFHCTHAVMQKKRVIGRMIGEEAEYTMATKRMSIMFPTSLPYRMLCGDRALKRSISVLVSAKTQSLVSHAILSTYKGRKFDLKTWKFLNIHIQKKVMTWDKFCGKRGNFKLKFSRQLPQGICTFAPMTQAFLLERSLGSKIRAPQHLLVLVDSVALGVKRYGFLQD